MLPWVGNNSLVKKQATLWESSPWRRCCVHGLIKSLVMDAWLRLPMVLRQEWRHHTLTYFSHPASPSAQWGGICLTAWSSLAWLKYRTELFLVKMSVSRVFTCAFILRIHSGGYTELLCSYYCKAEYLITPKQRANRLQRPCHGLLRINVLICLFNFVGSCWSCTVYPCFTLTVLLRGTCWLTAFKECCSNILLLIMRKGKTPFQVLALRY